MLKNTTRNYDINTFIIYWNRSKISLKILDTRLNIPWIDQIHTNKLASDIAELSKNRRSPSTTRVKQYKSRLQRFIRNPLKNHIRVFIIAIKAIFQFLGNNRHIHP